VAMGETEETGQAEFWIETQKLAQAPGHPFYRKLNALLRQSGFEAHVNEFCAKFYKEGGRPSVPPPVYFKMLMIGYFEGLGSERGIAWRCADSLSLREFLGYALNEETPDHSSLSRIRQRIDLQTHQDLFQWVLVQLAESDLLCGKTIGVDATTLEANAALRSIVRRDTGEKYNEFLTRLAKESGLETPTREDLAKIDRERKNKASNDDWKHPHDPDARITKMKSGSTHLAHKAEHAVDFDSGAVLAVTLQHANLGDTTTLKQTVAEATENLEKLAQAPEVRHRVAERVEEVIGDKGYHSNETLRGLTEADIRTYVSEPKQPRRNWEEKAAEQRAVYGNRRRVKGTRGKRLLRRRGELLERSFAHCYETGGLRRTWLQGHAKILKRLLIHVAAFNLSLILRQLVGHGTPRELAERPKALILSVLGPVRAWGARHAVAARSWTRALAKRLSFTPRAAAA
jgi:transposase